MNAPASSKAVVHLVDLQKCYETEAGSVTVLCGVNLRVNAGETVAVRGVSGSGKSTLLNILGAVDRPTEGQAIICGTDIGRLSRREQTAFRAQRVGFVFQFFNLIPTLTALENVMAAVEPMRVNLAEARDMAVRRLTEVGLGAHLDKLPGQLSGGEQQRVAIARAVVKTPPLILADEPTGSLDGRNAGNILSVLKEVQSEIGCALVIATHDPIVSGFVDRTLLVTEGRLEAAA